MNDKLHLNAEGHRRLAFRLANAERIHILRGAARQLRSVALDYLLLGEDPRYSDMMRREALRLDAKRRRLQNKQLP